MKKCEIIKYAKLNKLQWVEDSSNKSNQYDRNLIRNQVIPMLESRWENAVQMIGKSANNLNENLKFCRKHVKSIYRINSDGSINSKELKKLNIIEKRMIIRDWLKVEIGMSPDGKLVDAVIKQCVDSPAHNAGKIIKRFFTINKCNHKIKVSKR